MNGLQCPGSIGFDLDCLGSFQTMGPGKFIKDLDEEAIYTQTSWSSICVANWAAPIVPERRRARLRLACPDERLQVETLQVSAINGPNRDLQNLRCERVDKADCEVVGDERNIVVTDRRRETVVDELTSLFRWRGSHHVQHILELGCEHAFDTEKILELLAFLRAKEKVDVDLVLAQFEMLSDVQGQILPVVNLSTHKHLNAVHVDVEHTGPSGDSGRP